MLRDDLATARAEWIKAARRDPDELVRREQSDLLVEKNHASQVLDFQALRHTCGAWLVLAGVPLNVVQKVMRHSTITLTIDTYGNMLLGAEAAAVDGLAEFFTSTVSAPAEALQTGTDDMPVEKGAVNAQCAKQIPRESHARETHETAEILSPAGLEPTTYGLKVPETTNVNYDQHRGSNDIVEGARYADPELTLLVHLLMGGWAGFSIAHRKLISAAIDAASEI